MIFDSPTTSYITSQLGPIINDYCEKPVRSTNAISRLPQRLPLSPDLLLEFCCPLQIPASIPHWPSPIIASAFSMESLLLCPRSPVTRHAWRRGYPFEQSVIINWGQSLQWCKWQDPCPHIRQLVVLFVVLRSPSPHLCGDLHQIQLEHQCGVLLRFGIWPHLHQYARNACMI